MVRSRRLKKGRVYYSSRSYATVRAYTANGARRQAWDMLGDFKYGWTKADFLRNATVKWVGVSGK